MTERQGPMNTAWSILWLIVAAVSVMWFATKVLAVIWPWLLGGASIVIFVWLLIVWIRRGRDRL
jgi:hypothetical protein